MMKRFFLILILLFLLIPRPSDASELLNDDFNDGVADGWTVVDDGTHNTPSNWSVVSGVYTETSNLWGTASDKHWLRDDKFYGTYSYRGNLSWNDYVLMARVKSDDDDQVGLMFRYQDGNNYYRFFIDNQRSVRRLERKVGGVFTTLAEDFVPYVIGQWYDVRVEVTGSNIGVYVDDVEIFNITDSSLGSGMIGLYSWGNAGANFDDVQVTSAGSSDTTPPVWDSDVGICDASDTQAGGAVNVEFGSATDDVDGTNVRYNVYYAPSSQWDGVDWSNNSSVLNVSPTSGTACVNSYTISGLQNGVDYTFGVRAEDQSGNEDANSNTETATPTLVEPDTTPPVWGTPVGIAFATDTTVGGSVTIEFDNAIDAVDGSNVKYNVYYAETSVWNWSTSSVLLNVTPAAGAIYANSYTVTGLTDGVDYTFGVRAEDQSGNEDANSNTETATPTLVEPDTTPPVWGTPVGIAFATDTTVGGSVTIEFDNAIDAVDGSNVKYNVYYAETSVWNWSTSSVLLNVTPAAGAIYANSYTVTGLTDGVDYTFGVRAEDQSGNEDANSNTETATPTLVEPDTTPPVWGTPVGIAFATDTTVGGSVTIEFDNAIDAVDGSNVKYNVYYAETSVWNWSTSSVLLNVTPAAGAIYANSYTVTGLTDGVDYTFGVRAEDQSGNEDANTNTVTAIPTGTSTVLLSDDFNDGVADGWMVVDDGTHNTPSNWSVVSGVYTETSNLWGTASDKHWLRDDKFYGTYSYRGNLSWNDYVLMARVKSDDDDQVGLMFRYQDGNNYYRFFIDNQRSVRRLERKVGGVFTTLAEDFVPYVIGQWYDVRVEVTGSNIGVYVDDVEIFNVIDSSLGSGMIGLYSWGNAGANFDNIEVNTFPSNDTLLFTDITDSGIQGSNIGGHGAAWADIDQDGDPDVYVTRNYNYEDMSDLLFINISGGSFSEEGNERHVDDMDSGTHGAVWADLDNDGDYDLWNGSYEINNLYKNDGTGQFVDITSNSGIVKNDGRTRGVIAFDIDKDGDLDLFANNWGDESGQENELYRNDGNMTFTSISAGDLTGAIGSQGASPGDLDNDGDIDIVLADYFGDHNVYIFFNDSNGNFTLQLNSSIGLPNSGRCEGVTLADLNSDGYLDLIIADSETKLVYINNEDGSFTLRSSFTAPGYMAAAGDFDNDGDLDLYGPGDVTIFLNDGDANFIAVSNIGITDTSSKDPRCASLSDIDNDGDLDIINIHKVEYNVLLRNDSPPHSWIKFKLIRSNGQVGAFGSKIYVYEEGHLGDKNYLIGFHDVSSQQGYLAQNEPIVHFGLGNRDSADVRIVFPGGASKDLVNQSSNSVIDVLENQSPDTTPPVWDTIVGIALATDTETGGSVTVEFDNAIDAVDGSNVKYNVYYAETSVWNWSTSSVLLNVTPAAGAIYANSYTVTGLTDGVDYTFGVRAEDQSGNEDANSNTETATPTLVEPDTTPPVWGTPVGIAFATDTTVGGSVTIEFDNAIDAVDGSNVKYNVYYAETSVWNWSTSSVLLNVTPAAGAIYANSYTVTGLTDGVDYTFGVRAEDQSGNEDANTNTVTAIPTGTSTVLLSDDFNDGVADGWMVVDDGTHNTPSNWSVVSGVYTETSNLWGTASDKHWLRDDKFYGTYSYRGNLSWNDYVLMARVKSDDDDQVGLMFRYQDGNNYYRFFIDNQRSVRRLERKVGGVFTTLAEDFVPYVIGQWYDVRVEVTGSNIGVYVDDVEIFNITDSSLGSGMIGLYSWGNAGANFDDVQVTSAGSSDTTPPVWDSDVGICDASDTQAGGAVNVEFGSATDDVDGTNVRYNVYYAPSSQWDGVDWSNNSSVLNVSPTSGTACVNSYTISGLQNGVEYSFGVRVSDQSGNEEMNSVIVVATPSLFETFDDGNLDGWAIRNNGLASPNWYVSGGVLIQDVCVPGQTPDGFDVGTYVHLNDFNYQDGEIKVRLRSQGIDGIGVMFRYQDDSNYYRFVMSKRQGYRKLEKRVCGSFTELASDTIAYLPNAWYDVAIVNVGSIILVYLDGEPILAATDDAITYGSVALYTSRNDLSEFDSVQVVSPPSDPAVGLLQPSAYSVDPDNTFFVRAVTLNLPPGGGVEFVLDGGAPVPGEPLVSDPSIFEVGLPADTGTHSVDVYMLNSSDQRLPDLTAHDQNVGIGAGGTILVSFGDSITDGVGDDDPVDDSSNDGRNNAGGYESPLNNLLTNYFVGIPYTDIDEGTPADESSDGVGKVNAVLSRNSEAHYVLILFGTNDSGGSLPVDKQTFKSNMQQIVSSVLGAGKIPVLAKVLIALGPCSNCTPYANPWEADRNKMVISGYNEAIGDLIIENGLDHRAPDFYYYFENHQNEFFDCLHPNGEGYRSMANLWFQAMTAPGDTTPPVWDSDVGICDAIDTQAGGAVSVEFGSATDDMDGTNVRYNVYYAPSSQWDGFDWSNNSFVLNVSPASGTTCVNSYTISGLQNDVEYTFGVRVSDQLGNEDANTNTVTAIPTGTSTVLLSDDFNDGVADGWMVVDDGTHNTPSNWSVVSGVYTETSNLWGTASDKHWLRDDKFYGTYSYRGNLSWNDYVLMARVKSDDDDQVGLMFRYQDGNNYYRFFIDNQRSVRRLERKVGGVFTTLAEDFVPYVIGQWYDVRVEVTGSNIGVYVDDVEIFNVIDSSLGSGMIGLYSWGNAGANFDDVQVTQ